MFRGRLGLCARDEQSGRNGKVQKIDKVRLKNRRDGNDGHGFCKKLSMEKKIKIGERGKPWNEWVPGTGRY